VFDYARQKGLLLIRGVEWRSDHGDVLLYNIAQRELDRLRTLADLRAFRRDRGDDLLVIAAHPYFFQAQLAPSLRAEPGSVRCRGSTATSIPVVEPEPTWRAHRRAARQSGRGHFDCANLW